MVKGILCAKKKLFQNYVPVIPDGEWDYLDNIEEKKVVHMI